LKYFSVQTYCYVSRSCWPPRGKKLTPQHLTISCMHLLFLFHHSNTEPGRKSPRTHSTYFLLMHISPISHQHFLPTYLVGKQTTVIFILKIQDDQVGSQCDRYCVRLITFENASPCTFICLCTLWLNDPHQTCYFQPRLNFIQT
jgi:hypothetical protein